jgi:formylglycine-generating enzyme required for sulfatase activity
MKLNLIPSGRFVMGSSEAEAERHVNEGPQHVVAIGTPFYLGVHEVTQRQFKDVIDKAPANFQNKPEHPVENLSWTEAVEFCKRLSNADAEKKARRSYRLPTEAEWEYACRAGTLSVFHFGDDRGMLKDHAVHNHTQTEPIGRLKANAWGLFDLRGNVWEWCADFYEETYYRNSPKRDPGGPANGTQRVLRGGGYSDAIQRQ